jgi:hypothetical protein
MFRLSDFAYVLLSGFSSCSLLNSHSPFNDPHVTLIHYNALYFATRFHEKKLLTLTANDIIRLAIQIEMDEVDTDSVQELVYVYGTELMSKETMELEQQHCSVGNNDFTTDYDNDAERNLAISLLTDLPNTVNVMDIITENVLKFGHSTEVKRDVPFFFLILYGIDFLACSN